MSSRRASGCRWADLFTHISNLNHVIGPTSDLANDNSPDKRLDDDLPDERSDLDDDDMGAAAADCIDLDEDLIDLDDIAAAAEPIDLVEDRIDAIAVDRMDAEDDLPDLDDCMDDLLADDCDLMDDRIEPPRIEPRIDPPR